MCVCLVRCVFINFFKQKLKNLIAIRGIFYNVIAKNAKVKSERLEKREMGKIEGVRGKISLKVINKIIF